LRAEARRIAEVTTSQEARSAINQLLEHTGDQPTIAACG
jgi:hypothetical protein